MRFRLLATVLSILALTGASMPVHAGTFTSAEFLEWKQENKEAYIMNAIGMATLVVARYDNTHAKCISDMFRDDEQGVYKYTLDAMAQHPEFHPRATILAVIERKCQKLGK